MFWCAGIPLNHVCGALLTPAQWEWLSTTGVRLRSIRFHPDDEASSLLLFDKSILVRSTESQSQIMVGLGDSSKDHR